MWDLIRANRRRSVLLVGALGGLLVGCGAAIAYGLEPAAMPIGALGALVIWLILLVTSFAGGEQVLLSQANAREVDQTTAPQLYNVVEEMKIAAGLGTMPRVYVIDTPTPNAFAVGLSEKRAAVAVTTGLLARLSRDELQGVVAHEIAHIRHRDTMFMTLAGVTVGAVVLLADLYFRGMRFGGYRGRSSKDAGQAAALLAVLAVLLAILAPLLARMLYFACSRQREYLADGGGAQFTRYPAALASALEKISGLQQVTKAETSRVLAPMYIVNPLQAHGATGLFSTHPPTERRVQILRSMIGKPTLAAYDKAFHDLGGKGTLFPAGALAADAASDTPAPSSGSAPTPPPIPAWREAKETIHRLNAMTTVSCGCGLKLKLPPGFDKPRVACPRCGRNVVVPA